MISTLTVTGAGNATANGNYVYDSTSGTLINGQPVYRGGVGGSCSIVYQGNGAWQLVYNNDAKYQGGSAAGPTTANGAWSSLYGDNPPLVTANNGGNSMDIFTPAGEVFDGAYFLPETSRGVVPGGLVALALQAVTLMLEPNKPINDVIANGYVVPVGATSEKEWTSADISMALAVNDLIFLLSSGLCIPYVAQDTNHPSVFYWAFKPKGNARDTFQTYTATMGQDINGGSAPGLQVNSIDFTASEKTLDVKAKGFAQVYSDAAVAPANPTFVPLVPLSIDGHDVYMAATYAGLAAGHLQDCFTSKWSLPERYNPPMTQDSTVSSFSAVVQKKGQKPSAEIQVDRASHAAAYMAQLRSKGKGYCRMVSSGPQIGTTGINYAVQTTFPFQFHTRKNSQFQDADTATFGMWMIFDPTFLGGAWLDVVIATDMSPASVGLATQAGGGALPTQNGMVAADNAATAG